MSSATRFSLRSTYKQWRSYHKSFRAFQSVETQSVHLQQFDIPPPPGQNRPVAPKIDKLANEIAQLNLLEVSELSTVLKKRLNLPDAPAFPVGGFAVPSAAGDDDEEAAAPTKVQTLFTVKLMKFDEKQKVALIKEVKNLLEGMNLVQAKKFVESAPTVVKSDLAKDEAEKLKEAMEKVGGTIEIS